MEHNVIVFRRATALDLEAIVAMLGDDDLGKSREDTSLPVNSAYLKAFTAIQEDDNQLLGVADAGGAVIGVMQISFIPGLSRLGMWRGQIEGVRIARDHRSSGLGKKFLGWAITQCRNRDCQLVQLTTDKSRGDARRFYESMGFVASHEGMKLSLSV